MIEKCADYIAFYLVKNGLIEQDKMAIYKYGYEISLFVKVVVSKIQHFFG